MRECDLIGEAQSLRVNAYHAENMYVLCHNLGNVFKSVMRLGHILCVWSYQ